EGNFETLEPLLDIGIAGEVKPGIMAYVAYWHLRGKLDDRIAHFKSLLESKQNAEALSYLLRAKGDLPAALKSAQKADKPDLEEALLYEIGDWKELSKRALGIDPENLVEKTGYRAAYHRLAGNAKEFDETIAALKKLADGLTGDDPTLFAVTKALFLNDRLADAMELLNKGGQRQKIAEIPSPHLTF